MYLKDLNKILYSNEVRLDDNPNEENKVNNQQNLQERFKYQKVFKLNSFANDSINEISDHESYTKKQRLDQNYQT